ncbi:MAG: LLM class flavin-dependent oxidoreductase [Pseudomonadota bacterium]
MSEPIDFGIGLRRMDHIAEDAKTAEALGYQFISTGEHVFFYGPIGNGLIQLAAAAGATSTIQLMSAITLVPLYPPAILAKQVATLDTVSNGRFHLGVGVGGEFAKEFEACGVPVNERGARTNESLAILQKLWSEDDVHFEGRFTNLGGVTLAPKPKEPPAIWISGRSEAAMKRCARYGDGWLPYMYTPERLASSLTAIAALRGQYERTEAVRPGLYLFFAVHEDGDKAVQMASERLSIQYNQDFSKLVYKYALAGTPDQCIARLQEYIDAGARTIMLNSACPGDYVEENERLLASSVIPAFR